MPDRSRKPPRDANQLAKSVVDSATSDEQKIGAQEKDPAAVSLGRRGGLKGGPSRAISLSAERRKQIAKAAAKKRWAKDE